MILSLEIFNSRHIQINTGFIIAALTSVVSTNVSLVVLSSKSYRFRDVWEQKRHLACWLFSFALQENPSKLQVIDIFTLIFRESPLACLPLSVTAFNGISSYWEWAMRGGRLGFYRALERTNNPTDSLSFLMTLRRKDSPSAWLARWSPAAKVREHQTEMAKNLFNNVSF